MRRIELTVHGMNCRRCVRRASRILRDVPGVVTVSTDATTGLATLEGSMSPDDVLTALAVGSFDAVVASDSAAS